MPRYQVAFKAATKEALLQSYGDDTIAGHTNIGNFYHDGGGADVVEDHTEGHVLFHHVRDLLYPIGQLDMQSIKIKRTPLTAIDATAADVALNLTTDTSEQIAIAFTPATASNRSVTYVSSNPAVATVSATGLVTAVAVGTTTITVTSNDGGFTDTVAITVS